MNVISTPLPLSSRVLHATRSTTRIVRLIDRVNVFDAFQSAVLINYPPSASLSSSLSFSLETTHATKSRHAEIFSSRAASDLLSFFEIVAKGGIEAKRRIVHFRGKSLRKSWLFRLPYCSFFHATPFHPLINNSIEGRYP